MPLPAIRKNKDEDHGRLFSVWLFAYSGSLCVSIVFLGSLLSLSPFLFFLHLPFSSIVLYSHTPIIHRCSRSDRIRAPHLCDVPLCTLTSKRRDITEESFRIANEERIFHTYKSSAMIMTYIIMDVIIGVGDVVESSTVGIFFLLLFRSPSLSLCVCVRFIRATLPAPSSSASRDLLMFVPLILIPWQVYERKKNEKKKKQLNGRNRNSDSHAKRMRIRASVAIMQRCEIGTISYKLCYAFVRPTSKMNSNSKNPKMMFTQSGSENEQINVLNTDLAECVELFSGQSRRKSHQRAKEKNCI